MQAKFNIEWIKNPPGLTLWVHMTGLIQLIQNELYEYDGKKTVTQLHKMVYQYYDKSDFWLSTKKSKGCFEQWFSNTYPQGIYQGWYLSQ